MALSDRHLVAATIAACAFIVVTKLPPDAHRRDRRPRQPPEVMVQNRAKARLREAREKLALLERRDSALALAARRPAATHAGARVFYGGDIPTRFRSRLDSLLRLELDGIGASLTASPVIVFFATDTASRDRDDLPAPSRVRWIEAQYVLPAASDGRSCISIVRVGQSALDDRTRRNGRLMSDIALDGAAGKLLGPCAYMGAYGMPGRGVARWMARSGYGLGLRSPAPGTDTLRSAMPTFTPERETIVEVILRASGWSPQRDWLHPDLVACTAGDDGRCLAALSVGGPDSAGLRAPGLLRSSGIPFDRGAWPAERSRLMGTGGWLLASLHDEAGPEAFRRFWTSELAPDQAWASATGSPLSSTARRWIANTFDVGRTRRGPHPVALMLQLALGAAGIGGALLIRQRRTLAA